MKAYRTPFIGAVLAGLAFALAQPAAAAFPEKPVTFVVPFGVGGSFDTIARKLAQRWEKELGQPIVVKSLPGTGGRRGSIDIFRAKPDGYTIGFAHFVPFLADEFLMRKKPSIDYRKFEVIYKIAHDPNYLFVRKDLPWKSVKDMTQAKRTIKFASTGIGAITWTEANALGSIAGFKLNFVLGYSKLGDAAVAVAKGDAEAGLGGVAHFRGVKDDVRPLMFFGAERDPYYPDVPSAGELGFKQLTALGSPRIIVAPPGTPADRVAVFREAVKRAAADKEFQAWMPKVGFYLKAQDAKSTWEDLNQQGKVFDSLADAVAAAQKSGKKK
jgi:tripartite-type tricarboxylate transporter receptor subunit TctC